MFSITRMIHHSIIIPFRDFFYPPVCFTCDQLLHDDKLRVCSTCWESFKELSSTDPIWIEIKSRLEKESSVHDILSCFLFEKEGKLQDVIHLLKYQGMRSLGVSLGKEIGYRIRENALFSSADYLIPVPLHKLKHRERGYNQSKYICRGISEITQIPVHESLLMRTKYTQSQTELNLEGRRENVSGAFMINQKFFSLVRDQTFIIVDDVITTGSTTAACAKELINYGASKVLAASIALAQ